MKLKFFLLSLLLSIFSTLAYSQQLTIGSYNLRYENESDTGNLWTDRVPVVASLIRFHDFDVFGTQEGLKSQLDDIHEALPAYVYYGAGRDDGKDKGEHSAIFFKKEHFNLLKHGDFWLSETPDKPSLGWDAKCCFRICSWVYLQDKKTNKKFYFFNVHFDHEGIKAREESSNLILQKIKTIAGNEPVILTGDFNGGQQSSWYKTIANSGSLKDSYKEAQHPYANNGSFNAFGKSDSNEIIDHVFISKHFKVNKWGILTDSYHGKYPSDHFPVLVNVSY
ncbi:endonuclease/exonuclease/phosphatase family protein [Rubrolithibacter danxiaensis]|uniref:endonuclease/exonuclease/phosphatase family protein n=1 Tax=Rubrolithibacter danxiaensis TaxID=3390805 RepID=UPI003BF8878C